MNDKSEKREEFGNLVINDLDGYDKLKRKISNPRLLKYSFLFLVFLLMAFFFKALWLLLFFLIIDRIFVYLTKHTEFALKIEHVTIAAVITGYSFSIVYSLLITLILMIVLQIRNIKMTFFGAAIDAGIWFSLCFIAYFAKGLALEFSVLAFILPIGRFLVKLVMGFTFGIQIQELSKDAINAAYQVFFLRVIAPLIIVFFSVS